MRHSTTVGIAIAVAATAPMAHAASLPSAPSGALAGPGVLYAPPARAPQLENTGPWRAAPILVSGASAYRDGEYLYQDFVYDDHGANAQRRDRNDPGWSAQAFARPNGTYTYPADPRYAGNAADLVEIRIKPLADATAFRITLNTLTDPALVGVTIALGTSPAPVPWPHGANTISPAQLFLTVHGTRGDLVDAVGRQLVPAPAVTVDLERRQLDVRVPAAAWNPGRRDVRVAAAAGLWATGTDHYLLPQADADATHPGGAGVLAAPSAFFNVAFRHAEPMPNPAQLADETAAPSWWRDAAQGAELARGDVSGFYDVVDFGALRDGISDDMSGRPRGVPRSGPMDRILASRFSDGQGADYSRTCGTTTCHGELRGQLQPYAIYVPPGPVPAGGRPLTLLLHSLSSNYNQFLSNRNQSQFGQRGRRGSIVITPEGRGPDGWYWDWAGADTFEVWADVARNFRLDPERTAIAGYSMGGYATWKFASQYPDLFAAAQPTVGPTVLGTEYLGVTPPAAGEGTNTIHELASVRHVPFLIWVAGGDEIVPAAGTVASADELDRLGYRYEYDVFAPAEHLTLAINDEFGPAARWLGEREVVRDPAHVTYAYDPAMDLPGDGGAGGHAYWLSGVRLREVSGDPPVGTVDALSAGFGLGEPAATATAPTAGALAPGNLGVLADVGRARSWSRAASRPRADTLELKATNVAAVTVDVKRARLTCGAAIDVHSDGPIAVVLAGCGRTVRTAR